VSASPLADEIAALPAELPSPIDLASQTLSFFIANVLPMLWIGLAQTLVSIVASFIVIPIAFGCLCGLGLGGSVTAAALDAALDASGGAAGPATMLSMLAGYLGFFATILIGIAILSGPFFGSMVRALDRLVRTGEEISFGDVFTTAFKQPFKDVMSTLILLTLILLGLPFCYIGALIPAFFLMWFTWSCELDGVPLGRALSRSIRAVLARPSWCLGAFAIGVVFGILGGYVPILGPVATLVFYTKAYRALFPAPAEA
jgi:hypothetical protein